MAPSSRDRSHPVPDVQERQFLSTPEQLAGTLPRVGAVQNLAWLFSALVQNHRVVTPCAEIDINKEHLVFLRSRTRRPRNVWTRCESPLRCR